MNLNEQLARETSIIESIGEPLVVTDREGDITTLNTAAKELFNENSIGKSIFEAITLEDDQGNILVKEKRSLHRALITGKIFRMQAYINSSTQIKKIPVAINSSPLLMNNEVIGAVDIFYDISQEKDLERAKDEFLSIAAHQLRTPLGTMRWNIERLLGGKFGELPAEIKKRVIDIYESDLQLIELVNDLLDLSKINQGKIIDQQQPTDIYTLLNNMVKEMTIPANQKKVSLHVEEPKQEIPSVLVDPKLMNQVIQNILSNAIKYNIPDGTVTIRLELLQEVLEIQIADNGIGIPKKDQPRIFEKFTRAENAIQTNSEGSGLGLFVARSYLERWHGKIWIESELQKGTTVFITLPIHKEASK